MWLTKAHTSQEAPTSISGSSSHRIRVIYEFSKKEATQKINNWLNNNPGFIGIVEVKVRK